LDNFDGYLLSCFATNAYTITENCTDKLVGNVICVLLSLGGSHLIMNQTSELTEYYQTISAQDAHVTPGNGP